MCHKKYKKVLVMMIEGFISLLRKLFENDMYFISTETGNVEFHPRTVSKDDVIIDTEEE